MYIDYDVGPTVCQRMNWFLLDDIERLGDQVSVVGIWPQASSLTVIGGQWGSRRNWDSSRPRPKAVALSIALSTAPFSTRKINCILCNPLIPLSLSLSGTLRLHSYWSMNRLLFQQGE